MGSLEVASLWEELVSSISSHHLVPPADFCSREIGGF